MSVLAGTSVEAHWKLCIFIMKILVVGSKYPKKFLCFIVKTNSLLAWCLVSVCAWHAPELTRPLHCPKWPHTGATGATRCTGNWCIKHRVYTWFTNTCAVSASLILFWPICLSNFPEYFLIFIMQNVQIGSHHSTCRLILKYKTLDLDTLLQVQSIFVTQTGPLVYC